MNIRIRPRPLLFAFAEAMRRPRRTETDPRKLPSQARSRQLVADLIQAAIRVLERDGAGAFTTIRVAEVAGVSVGSLYQYFPNKEAILYRLQVEEWARTTAMLERILGDRRRSPALRLRDTTRAFFQSECDEVGLRQALDAAAPAHHDAPESRAHRERARRLVASFLAELAPRTSRARRARAADLLAMTLGSLGKEVSERRPSARECRRWADDVSDMLLLWIARLDATRGSAGVVRARSGGPVAGMSTVSDRLEGSARPGLPRRRASST